MLTGNEICQVTPAFDMEILEGAAIKKLYGDHRFHMAMGYSQDSNRRDMLAVVAYENNEILGGLLQVTIQIISGKSVLMWYRKDKNSMLQLILSKLFQMKF